MIKVVSSIVINRPMEEVFKYISHFENDTAWYPTVLESKIISDVKEGVGTRYWQRSKLLGRSYETVFEVTEYDPPKHLHIKDTQGGIPFVATYTLEPASGGTKFTMDAGVDAVGFYNLVRPLFIYMLRRQTDGFFEKLKRIMETKPEAAATG